MSGVKWLLHNYGKKGNCQRFGKYPTTVRNSDHYIDEYVHGLVERWDYLIDWNSRAKNEAIFISSKLDKRGALNVLDSATGTGFDSIQLLHAGFTVTSMDGSYGMLVKAKQNAKKENVKLSIMHLDWREMRKVLSDQYDAIICLGNSISHLFTKEEQKQSLLAFYRCLKPNGILIVDHLNYERIFQISGFDRHTLYYTGKDVDVVLEHSDRGLIRFSYKFPLNWVFFLHYFPIIKDQFKKLLSVVGFKKIQIYGDFSQEYNANENEFYIYVAEKPS